MKKYILTYAFESDENTMKALDEHLRTNVFPDVDGLKHIEHPDNTRVIEEYSREACGFCVDDVIGCARDYSSRAINETQASEIMDIMEHRFDANLGMGWETISIWVDFYFEERPLVKIKYVNIDDHNRPIFKSEHSYYGSVNILFPYGATEEEVKEKVTEFDLSYFGNTFNCEPLGDPMKPGVLFIDWNES